MGYPLNKEIHIHLKESKILNEAAIGGDSELTKNRYGEKDYIGSFMPMLLNLSELKKNELKIKRQLQSYCPKLNLDKHSIHLFSQLFLS